MFETVINLKPRANGGRRDGRQPDRGDGRALQFPGVSNAWTMPIKARIDMLSTGIRTPIGVKVIGTDLHPRSTRSPRRSKQVLKAVPGTSSAYAERGIGGYYLDVTPDREALARYGIMVQDVQDVVATAMGGKRSPPPSRDAALQRQYALSARPARRPETIATMCWCRCRPAAPCRWGSRQKSLARGPTTIRTENAQLAELYLCRYPRPRSRRLCRRRPGRSRPAGPVSAGRLCDVERPVRISRARRGKLKIVVPVTLAIIFLLLFLNFRSLTETLIVMLSLPFALVGGLWLMWWLGFNCRSPWSSASSRWRASRPKPAW
jgi:Cu(I)/Ag(I) efflux system membrane protein CusA/SilA